MLARWTIGAVAAIAAVGALALLRDGGSEPPLPETAGAPMAAERGGAHGERRLARVAEERREAAPRTSRSGRADADDTADDVEAPIEEQLRWTEDAITSSRRIAELESQDAEPAPPERRAPGLGTAVVTLCRHEGSTCRSSAECCPGLACAGGVAGYGTAGRCEGER